MAIEQDLTDMLKQAMRDKDQPALDAIRMLKSRMQERRTAKGFSGEVDDALWVEVIGAYRKSMQKALEEYEKLGERGAEQVAKLGFEIRFCERWLPKGLSEDELRQIVAERISALGLTASAQAGRLVGEVMKTHRGRAEAADVKRIAEQLLGGA